MAVVRKSRGRYVADFRDQNRRRRIETPKGVFETLAIEKRAANELLQERLSEVDSRTYTPVRGRLTFAQVAKKWLESKVRLRDSTRADYQTMLDCYLLPYFGPRKYESVSRLDVEQFRADLQAGVPQSIQHARDLKLRELQKEDPTAWLRPLDPGPRTINKCLGVLTSIGFYASTHNLATKNVAERIEKLPSEEAGDGEDWVIEENILTPAELVRAINGAVDPYRAPIAIGAYCGPRQAEVLGLQWDDIDLVRGTAAIRRTQRRGVFSKPKSKASRRTIELPAPLIAELKRWRQVCPKSDRDLVCPSVTGLPMQASALLQRGVLSSARTGGDPPRSIPRPAPLLGEQPIGGGRQHRRRFQRPGTRQRIHHAEDLHPRDTEGTARDERSDGQTHGPKWKQNGNKRGGGRDAALDGPSATF
jgi:integrase